MTARAALAAAALAICGCALPPPVRTRFDRTDSTRAAVALATRMIAAAGGDAAWGRVRQLGWLEGTVENGRLVRVEELVWDRAGSRLRRVQISPDDAVTVVMGSLTSDRGAAYRVTWKGCLAKFLGNKRVRVVRDAASRLRAEALLLALPFSLKARGVALELTGERVTPTVLVRNDEPPQYDVLRATVAATGEAFNVIVSKKTLRPVLLEQRQANGVLVGTYLGAWKRVGGILLATRRDDAASTAGAKLAPFTIPRAWRGHIALKPFPAPARGTVTIIRDLAARGEVDPTLFVPDVRGPAAL